MFETASGVCRLPFLRELVHPPDKQAGVPDMRGTTGAPPAATIHGMTPISRRIIVGTLIAIHLGGDLLWPRLCWPARGSEWLLAASLGLFIAQVNLVAVWAALAPGRLMVRLPWSLFLATLMWYAVVLGFRWSGRDRFTFENAITLGLMLLFGVLVTQLPLWVANRWFRWRLTSVAEDTSTALSERQYGIRHLLAGMFLLGLALGLGRVVLPLDEAPSVHLERAFLVLIPAMAICNLMVTVPCIWCAFAPWSRMLPLAIGWVVYAATVSLTEVGVLILFLGPPGDNRVFAAFGVMNVTQCVTVWLTCVVLRWAGFRLTRRPATTG